MNDRVLRPIALLMCLAAGSGAWAEGPSQTPAPEPKAAPPASVTTEGVAPPRARVQTSGRDQFIAPVMGIDIKGEGIALPPGVAKPPEEPIKPPAAGK